MRKCESQGFDVSPGAWRRDSKREARAYMELKRGQNCGTESMMGLLYSLWTFHVWEEGSDWISV